MRVKTYEFEQCHGKADKITRDLMNNIKVQAKDEGLALEEAALEIWQKAGYGSSFRCLEVLQDNYQAYEV